MKIDVESWVLEQERQDQWWIRHKLTELPKWEEADQRLADQGFTLKWTMSDVGLLCRHKTELFSTDWRGQLAQIYRALGPVEVVGKQLENERAVVEAAAAGRPENCLPIVKVTVRPKDERFKQFEFSYKKILTEGCRCRVEIQKPVTVTMASLVCAR